MFDDLEATHRSFLASAGKAVGLAALTLPAVRAHAETLEQSVKRVAAMSPGRLMALNAQSG